MMKTGKIKYLLLAAALSSFLVSSCSKEDSSTTSSMSGQQVSETQNSDSQDAIADKTDQDVDNTLDELQSNNYQVTSKKSGTISGSINITVDHPDSTTFPKVITIVYNNYKDSTCDETFTKNGEIDVTVSLNSSDLLKVKRTQTFKSFSITTDSTRVTVNGTRTVQRTKYAYKLKGLQDLRLSATDNITANLNYAIVKTGQTDSMKFTRIVDKLRTVIAHYKNVGGTTWRYVKFVNVLPMDTVTFTGTVTGTNEKGDTYTKTVAVSTPITVTFYKAVPVVSSGTMALTLAAADNTAKSFTFTYKQDLPDHPFKTLVTVTNNTTLKTHSFDRRYSRKFYRWWL